MALWQFDVRIIPRAAVVNPDGSIPLSISQIEYEQGHSWRGFNSLSKLPRALSKISVSRNVWSKEIQGWGEEDGDRVDLYRSDADYDEWYVRFDMREPNYSFIRNTVELVAEYDGVFVTSSRYVVEPSYRKLLIHMARSNAAKFIEDPEGFLKNLASEEDIKTDN